MEAIVDPIGHGHGWTSRDGFLTAAGSAGPTLSSPVLAERWDDSSVLAEMTVGDLAAHLTRALTTLMMYLSSEPDPAVPALSAAEYFVTTMGDPADLASSVNAGIRGRSRGDAAGGREVVLRRWHESVVAVRQALDTELPTRRVGVAGGLVLTLDEYLKTRTVEIVLHVDDLALSLGIEPPRPSQESAHIVARTLLDVARLRSGDLAVLRAMARRGRQSCDVLLAF